MQQSHQVLLTFVAAAASLALAQQNNQENLEINLNSIPLVHNGRQLSTFEFLTDNIAPHATQPIQTQQQPTTQLNQADQYRHVQTQQFDFLGGLGSLGNLGGGLPGSSGGLGGLTGGSNPLSAITNGAGGLTGGASGVGGLFGSATGNAGTGLDSLFNFVGGGDNGESPLDGRLESNLPKLGNSTAIADGNANQKPTANTVSGTGSSGTVKPTNAGSMLINSSPSGTDSSTIVGPTTPITPTTPTPTAPIENTPTTPTNPTTPTTPTPTTPNNGGDGIGTNKPLDPGSNGDGTVITTPPPGRINGAVVAPVSLAVMGVVGAIVFNGLFY